MALPDLSLSYGLLMRKYNMALTALVRGVHKGTKNSKGTELVVVRYRIHKGKIYNTCITNSSSKEEFAITVTECDFVVYINKPMLFRTYKVFGIANLTLWVHSYTDGGSIPVTGLSRIECYLNYIALYM